MTDRYEDFYAKQPEFLGDTVIEITVPSGRLIAADSLCSVKKFDVDPPLSINYGYGLDAWARKLAEVNVAYAFVGNTCPSVTRRPDGLLHVATPAWNDEIDDAEFNDDEQVVAKICTDLWATMLTDYQNWLDNGGPEVATANAPYALEKYSVFDVTPGKYRWTVFSHSDRFDTHAMGRIAFAQLELIEAY
ncbi:hypothetical protein Achl_4041 (plasmid) [Pseudarthrobacter chlorophenolicus A6]|uniref:Uncharacterized protein n=1 Tax=Pseudarthrobacter chlorophenolicus (strain ATCC 700700 / DSM 12829 / CIP 107037 / JCM 12360 / KCTC 9906 / NCIMB 13794 / A6) TaxID=452863 RepID=B8HHU5_PSECP|nr:hypothetical protein [Pseudarthrobacter chlorophenolicus]ACL41992.1 hypothetical protein Achl_4041 [Pseudarthrobacter chlorophenolicus A6]SDQ20000.1 hypothetical protein SAMN04489738_0692 [Pseudarthrobacter chlorophenolicus]